jgi:hypothetical protein
MFKTREHLKDCAAKLIELEQLEELVMQIDNSKFLQVNFVFDSKTINNVTATSKDSPSVIQAIKQGLLTRMDTLRKRLYSDGVDVTV